MCVKQLIGLESRQSQEMNEHLRSQERELEQLHHQWEKDLERLRTKNKSELENRVSTIMTHQVYCCIVRVQ